MADELQMIGEVFETQDNDIANDYLKLGWRLIATHTKCVQENPPDHQTVYCLGWHLYRGAVKHPKGALDDLPRL